MNTPSVIVCLGAGGVGKTTVASVVALHHALAGQKTLVITLDPARRLMDALGIKGKGHKPKRVDLAPFMGADAKKSGALYAYMPDLKKEWMDFLTAAIERESVQKKIATNHFYQHMAEGIPGSLEIIASHVLFRIMDEDDYDIIILDTPPASHSVSFLDVPRKIIAVLEESIFQKLMDRRHSFLLNITKKIAFFSGGLIESTFERLIGSHFLSELLDFALTIDGLYAPMLKRARAMDELLHHAKTRYFLVARPTRASALGVSSCIDTLQARGLSLSQIVINQLMSPIDDDVLQQEFMSLSEAQREMIGPTIDDYKRQQSYEKRLVSTMLLAAHDTPACRLYKEPDHNRINLLKGLLTHYERGAH